MRTEIYISVKDLIAECIRKVWVIIICMLIFGCLLAGYKYKNDKAAAEASVAEEAQNLDDALALLSDADYNSVMSYVNFNKYVVQQQEYINNSMLMQIDPYHVNIATLQYYVTTQDENSKQDVIVAYLAYINNGSLAEDMKKSIKGVSVEDIKSLITCDATGPVPSNATFMTGNSNVINISVFGASKEQCQEFAGIMKNCIATYGEKLNAYAPNACQVLDESYNVQTVPALITYQSDKMNNLATWNTRIGDEGKELDDSVLSIAQQLIALEGNVEKTDTAVEEEAPVKDTHVSVSKKFLVLGALIGALLSVIFVALVYILDGRLKTSKELQMMYGLRSLGTVAGKKPNVFEKLANIICYQNASASKLDQTGALTLSQIKTLCANESVNELVIVGPNAVKTSLENVIIKELNAAKIKTAYVGDVLADESAIKALSKDAKVIVAENARKSLYVDVDQRIDAIKNQGVEILGYITVK